MTTARPVAHPRPRGRDRSARPRWQRRKQARPDEILAAALATFVERGFAGTRLDEVARRAGVTKGTVYLYFDNKEALFKAMVREAMVPAIQRGEQLIDQHAGSSRDLIEQLVRGWWKTLGEARASGLPKLIVAEAANFPELARFYHQEVVQRGRRVFSRAIERGVGCGEFRPVDVEYLPRAITASILAAAIWKHSIARYEKEPFRFERFIDALIDLALNGLLAGERPHA